uniref:Uncharacterized protein n=1 Tax=Phaeomonas parva TaxID=124430 RepID=A0A7S1XY42_9STRA|mmetsp:Transcript_44499/g.139576  ORF Transcript_44499/g.139576 Transcript_44499/m.139576 type:complete len:1251 (+) Transcript_44499:224-3976(+)
MATADAAWAALCAEEERASSVTSAKHPKKKSGKKKKKNVKKDVSLSALLSGSLTVDEDAGDGAVESSAHPRVLRSRNGGAAPRQGKARSAEGNNDESMALISPELSPEDALQALHRFVNQIETGETSRARKNGLAALQRNLFAPEDGTHAASSAGDENLRPRLERRLPQDVLEHVFSETSQTLFKKFSDPVEQVRELSVNLVTLFFCHVRDLTQHIGYFFPALCYYLNPDEAYDAETKVFVHNIDAHEEFKRGRAVIRQDRTHALDAASERVSVRDASEEMRYLYVRMLHTLLYELMERGAERILGPYLHETILFLQAQLRDPCPKVKMEACRALKRLAVSEVLTPGTKLYAIALARAVFPVLRHRHARVRLAAVEAVHAIVMIKQQEKCKGAGTEAIEDLIGFRADNVLPVGAFYNPESGITVNYLAELCVDKSAAVRVATGNLLKAWVTELPDRYDHWPRLTPYVLNLCADVDPEVAQVGLEAIRLCGAEYEREHTDEVIERRQFGVDGDKRCNHARARPEPFADRPRIGARLFVRGHSIRFLKPLIRELSSWKDETQLSSLRLLRIVLVFCEEHLTGEMHWIVPNLTKAVRAIALEAAQASTADTREKLDLALECCDILGRYMAPETYSVVLMPRVVGDIEIMGGSTTSAERAVTLLVFASLCNGALPQTLVSQGSSMAVAMAENEDLLEAATESLRPLGAEENAFDASVEIPLSAASIAAFQPSPIPAQLMTNVGASLLWLLVTFTSRMRDRGKDAVTAHFLNTGRLQSLSVILKQLTKAILTLRGALLGSALEAWHTRSTMEAERKAFSATAEMFSEPVRCLLRLCDNAINDLAHLAGSDDPAMAGSSPEEILAEKFLSTVALEAVGSFPRGVHWTLTSPEYCLLTGILSASPSSVARLEGSAPFALVDLTAEIFEGCAAVGDAESESEGVLDAACKSLTHILQLGLERSLEASKLETEAGAPFVEALRSEAAADLLSKVVACESTWTARERATRLSLLEALAKLLRKRFGNATGPSEGADGGESGAALGEPTRLVISTAASLLNSILVADVLAKSDTMLAKRCLSVLSAAASADGVNKSAGLAIKRSIERVLDHTNEDVVHSALRALEELSDEVISLRSDGTFDEDLVAKLFRIFVERPPMEAYGGAVLGGGEGLTGDPAQSVDGAPSSMSFVEFLALKEASQGPGDVAEGLLRRVAAADAAAFLQHASSLKETVARKHPARRPLLDLIDHAELIQTLRGGAKA